MMMNCLLGLCYTCDNMITKAIYELPDKARHSIQEFYYANADLLTHEYMELFHKTFRCTTEEISFGEWTLTFEDADYTWFILKWGTYG